MSILTVDYIIVPVGWLAGNIIFNNFEKHLPLSRRSAKFIMTIGILYAIGYFFGKYALYSVVALMGTGMAILHAWWFPRQGINGLTAEPYNRYLRLIRQMKGYN